MTTLKRFFDPGHPWLMLIVLIAALLALSGCATPPKVEEPLTVHDANAARAMALQKIGESGDPETKRLAIFALVTMGQGGQAAPPQIVQGPRSVGDAIFGFLDRTLERLLNVAPAYLAYRGQVRSAQTTETVAGINRDVSINQSNNFLALGSAGIGGTATVGVAGVNALASVAGRPLLPTTNISGNTGPVLVGGGSYYGPVTRNYTGGNEQTGTGTATIPTNTESTNAATC